MIPTFKQFLVEENREAFFTFGRMNPPTIGHGKLMSVLGTKAGRNPYYVYLSQSSDPKKNPLSYDQKIKHVRKMFPKHARNVILNKKIKTVMDIASSLHDQGFNRVTMVVGADRITEFETLLRKYNGVKGRHGFYNFEKISVVSAGERDPDAEGVEGMSASKQRANAQKNDFTTFSQGVPSSMSDRDAKRLFNDIRVGMGLKETKEFKNHINLGVVSETRERYLEGELFNEGDRVITKAGLSGHIHRLGSNYVIVALDEGRISRQWLDDVELEERLDGRSTTDLIKSFFDRHKNKKKYQQAVRLFLDMRKKNPGQANKMLHKVGQMTGADIRELDRVLRDMVAKGAMPKHLLNYPSLQGVKTAPFRESTQPEWGTDASTRKAKKMTPNEDSVQDPDIKDRKGTQPKRYHTGLKKATKIARDRHFKKHGKKADDDSSAYKPAPGDKTAETKPSKYTKAYNKMFGEKFKRDDEVSSVRKTINRELDADKIRHDRMIDRARIVKARRQARETDPRKESTKNPVAKHAHKFNKAAVHTDKKKATKKGYIKHKGKNNEV